MSGQQEQFYANKLNNLVDKFPERHKLTKTNEKEIYNLKKLTSISKLELVAKNFLSKTASPDSFSGEFYPTFKIKIILYTKLPGN